MISVFKDLSGYKFAAKNYLRALQDDPNLIARSIRYDSGSLTPLSSQLKALHDKPIDESVEVVVQMLTPNEMRPVEGKINIAICCWETDRIPQHWVDQLNKFNKVIVPCEANKQAFIDSGVTVPIIKIPFCFFKGDYEGITERFDIPGTNPETVVFYNISQFSPKKAIDKVIQAYYLAFQNDENVILVLKTYIGMRNQQGDAQKILGDINRIRQEMRLPKYPKIYVTDQMMTDKEILKLHNSCHTYINLSTGEGWGIPAFESLLMGKELVSINHTGITEYLPTTVDSDKCYAGDYYKVPSYKAPVMGMNHPDSELYTSRENWYLPDVLQASKTIKESFNTIEKRNKFKEQWFKLVDPQVIKEQLIEVING